MILFAMAITVRRSSPRPTMLMSNLLSFFLLHLLLFSLRMQQCIAGNACLEEGFRITDDLSSNNTLSSPRNVFELGFFTPDGSTNQNRYIGIWYRNYTSMKIVVWVANRGNPLLESNASLTIGDGNAKLLDKNGLTFWSSDSAPIYSNSSSTSSSVILHNSQIPPKSSHRAHYGKKEQQLLNVNSTKLCLNDNGNLILVRDPLKSTIWQSFDHPTDTFLPGMVASESVNLTSWQSSSIPAPGDFTLLLQQTNLTVVLKTRSTYFENAGTPVNELPPKLVELLQGNISAHNLTRLVIDFIGQVQLWEWDDNSAGWSITWFEPKDRCSFYSVCENFGSCNSYNGWLCKSLVIAPLLAIVLMGGVFICRKKRITQKTGPVEHIGDNSERIDLPFFDWESILSATNNFADENKLGTGGFGSVYRGNLPDGQEIAVKRLSSISVQGVEEFRTEVVLIAKLQHRNLVRLLGYCVKDDEKILVYEYMPNGSLDSCLFDQSLSLNLDWEKRFDIISGIARGLLYLHQDSRLRIIHRDLKPSNILLDDDLNPKISDFGIARIVQGKQRESCTKRVVGTYGYMSPEYAHEGIFSVKSDVFSFGVVVLETIGGRRNSRIFIYEHGLSLLGYAWKLWTEDRAIELADQTLIVSCNISEVLKCIQIALLCIQEDPSDRPTMSGVFLMLISENASLPPPKKPAFSTRKPHLEYALSSSAVDSTSIDMTIDMPSTEFYSKSVNMEGL